MARRQRNNSLESRTARLKLAVHQQHVLRREREREVMRHVVYLYRADTT